MLSPESRRNNKLLRSITNVNVLQLKKYITAEIWNTLKHKRNAKPTLIGAVVGGSGIIGSHAAKHPQAAKLILTVIYHLNQFFKLFYDIFYYVVARQQSRRRS